MENANSPDRSCARLVTPRRRFMVLDAMILVAATGIGFALVNSTCGEMLEITWSWLRDECSDAISFWHRECHR
jgi:hypothetical protein